MSEAESGTIYDQLGGAAFTRALADRFYDIMESDPAYAGLRAMHEPDLGPMRESFAGFLATWLGGPRDWLAARGGGFCVMSRHAGMGITAETAGQWVAAMRAAMAELVTDARLRAKIDEAFTRLAAAMARGGGENA